MKQDLVMITNKMNNTKITPVLVKTPPTPPQLQPTPPNPNPIAPILPS
ncbi:hypothetical protein [Paenibacillus sp. RC67]|nr:hypothetical protein [Paenibacillus sp. RC67]